jgi:hypothetical protein
MQRRLAGLAKRLWIGCSSVLLVAVIALLPLVMRAAQYVYAFDVHPWLAARFVQPALGSDSVCSEPQPVGQPDRVDSQYVIDVNGDLSPLLQIFKHCVFRPSGDWQVSLFTRQGEPGELYIHRLIDDAGDKRWEIIGITLKGLTHRHEQSSAHVAHRNP